MPSPKTTRANALIVTMVVTAAALLTLTGILSWSNNTARLTGRSNQYQRSVSAAEAATEKAASMLMSDFLSGGEALVTLNLNNYRLAVPTAADSSYWSAFQFTDAQGDAGETYVQKEALTNYTVLGGTYAGLQGFISSYDIISNARETNDPQSVTAAPLPAVAIDAHPHFPVCHVQLGRDGNRLRPAVLHQRPSPRQWHALHGSGQCLDFWIAG